MNLADMWLSIHLKQNESNNPRVKSLLEILEKARNYKFLGPISLEDHIKNGKGFVEVLSNLHTDPTQTPYVVDLGSGGGVPALIIAEALPKWNFLLIERKIKRVEFLQWAIENTVFGKNIKIYNGEAENAAGDHNYAKSADFVTSRSFGPPSVTAECSCCFLKKGGHLIVSEPPKREERWPTTPLAVTGLYPITIQQPKYGSFQALKLKKYPEERFPRRPGVARKRPLW
ncbi:MAG: class I SAM-dependent methyltransferase [Acidimicrobiales bacterium]|nr:class I SAM-dependent methyltransferase [Acidimicrobiales bacterium]